MRRREFIFALGSAPIIWSRTSFAQLPDRMRVIGWLSPGFPNDPVSQTFRAAFTSELSRVGWIEGQNLRIEVRWAFGDPERVRALAKELIELRPDVIVAATSLSLGALARETSTIPIVFVAVGDPIIQGYITNLASPGANITGFTTTPEFSISARLVPLLKEIVPNVSRIGLMINPEATESLLGIIDASAISFGAETIRMPIYTIDQMEGSVAEFAGKPNGAIIVLPDFFTGIHRDPVIRAMATHRLPAVYHLGVWAREGGLIAYGNDFFEQSRAAGSYVDRILRGEKPGDLPVQQPTKFELVINLKTAKALGFTIPKKLLSLADEVIE
jgi:putative tryptophan/tyrosine transport system substrate-binding protein